MADPSISVHDGASGGNVPVLAMPSTTLERARQSLASYFLFSAAEGGEIPAGVILTILLARKESLERNDRLFEQFILETGKYCDERLDNTTAAGKKARTSFLRLADLLHRVEEASQPISKLVFFAQGIPESDTLKILSLIWDELNAMKPGLFRELLVDGLLASDLLGRMGRNRLTTLLEGLDHLSRGTANVRDIQQRLEQVERHEQILVKIVTTIQNSIGSHYGWVAGDGERETIKRIVSIELRHQRLLNGDISDTIFDLGLQLAKSSLMYMNTLLPIIISQGDINLREEFIRDSGMDRLFVEELEEFWCNRENIDQSRLAQIQRKP